MTPLALVAAFFDWLTSSPPATIIAALGTLMVGSRFHSSREHVGTNRKIDLLIEKVDSLSARVARIEKLHGIEPEPRGRTDV